MSVKRTRRYVGRIQRVYIYRPHEGFGRVMQQVDNDSPQVEQFFFDGEYMHFHELDAKDKKFIAYESIEQVQVSTRRSKKVRLSR